MNFGLVLGLMNISMAMFFMPHPKCRLMSFGLVLEFIFLVFIVTLQNMVKIASRVSKDCHRFV